MWLLVAPTYLLVRNVFFGFLRGLPGDQHGDQKLGPPGRPTLNLHAIYLCGPVANANWDSDSMVLCKVIRKPVPTSTKTRLYGIYILIIIK